MQGRAAARTLVAVLPVWLAGAALLAQQDLTGRAIVSYNLFGNDQLNFRGFQQIYDVRYVRAVAEPFRLRLSFRGQGNNGQTELGLSQTNTTYWQLQPSAEAWYTLPKIQLHGTYDLYDTRSSYSDVQDVRKLQRLTASLAWLPDDFPALTAQVEQNRQKDQLAGIDQNYGFVQEGLSFTRPTFTLGQTATYQTFDLNTSDFTHKLLGVQGQGQYQDTLLNGRLTASAYVVVGVSRIEDMAKGQAASVPTQVVIPSASVSVDETPADSRDVPPLSAPALTDGNFARSGGVSVGPDGASFQNILLDPHRFVALDQLRVFVRDSAGNFVKIGGLVRWEVYTSVNNLDWTPVPGSASTAFVTTLSAYDVTFPKAAARYFKLVSFGTSTVETLVTEVQAFFHTSFAAGESARTDLKILSTNVQLTGRLTDWLTLSYYGLLNDYTTSASGKADYGSLDHDQLVTLEGKPSEKFDLILRYESRHAESGTSFAQTLSSYWATAQYAFSPRLNTTLEASRTTDKNALNITTDTLRLHQYARVYGSLEVSADVGVARQDETTLKIRALQTFLTAYSNAHLTQSLQLILSANLQQTKFEGSGAADLEVTRTRDERAYAELFYRPSAKLLLSARFGYVWGTAISTTINTYRLEWYPFAGGTIGIGTIYDEDVQTTFFNQRFRRIQILPHWQINRYTILDVNYSWLTLKSSVPGAPPQTKAKQLYATVTLTL